MSEIAKNADTNRRNIIFLDDEVLRPRQSFATCPESLRTKFDPESVRLVGSLAVRASAEFVIVSQNEYICDEMRELHVDEIIEPVTGTILLSQRKNIEAANDELYDQLSRWLRARPAVGRNFAIFSHYALKSDMWSQSVMVDQGSVFSQGDYAVATQIFRLRND